MHAVSRRAFGKQVLLTAPAVASAGLLARAQETASQSSTNKPSLGEGGLGSWPKGFAPNELGTAVATHFSTSPHLRPTRILYPEVCAWYGALTLAHATGNQQLIQALQARFEPLFSTEGALLPPKGNHVDFSMFGSLPLELYRITRDKRYLDLGMSYADAQWAKTDAQGLTPETRFWIDDMYMVTIVQVQAFRVTGEAKYLDRAAQEMAAYLDKLQQPNGLFYHAPDVPFFWGRGNGWFAAGMAELLTDLPQTHPLRSRILRGYNLMMSSLLRYQGADGSWRQLIDRQESWAESSGTGMFAFALITGVRKGWLPRDTFEPAARRSWIALAGYVDQDSNVASVCEGTNKFNDLNYYLLRKRRTGDFHGQAPLLWSATALLRPA